MTHLSDSDAREALWVVPEPRAIQQIEMPDGAVIVLRRHGNPDGTRVVISHANGFASDAYYPFWSLLVDRFDVVLFDFRNHGWNPLGPLSDHNIPNFVSDMRHVSHAISLHFGPKPAIGVFHSVSGQVAALDACSGTGTFAALILFDPFICPDGCHPQHRERFKTTMGQMVEAARRRRASFETKQAFAERLRKSPAFELLLPGVTDLVADATLRPETNESGWVLRCPRDYEAHIAEQGLLFADTVDVEAFSCPVKVIGSDPLALNSYMPTVAMDEIIALNYDFVPDTTHFLQLEEPQECLQRMLEFTGPDGKAALEASG